MQWLVILLNYYRWRQFTLVWLKCQNKQVFCVRQHQTHLEAAARGCVRQVRSTVTALWTWPTSLLYYIYAALSLPDSVRGGPFNTDVCRKLCYKDYRRDYRVYRTERFIYLLFCVRNWQPRCKCLHICMPIKMQKHSLFDSVFTLQVAVIFSVCVYVSVGSSVIKMETWLDGLLGQTDESLTTGKVWLKLHSWLWRNPDPDLDVLLSSAITHPDVLSNSWF